MSAKASSARQPLVQSRDQSPRGPSDNQSLGLSGYQSHGLAHDQLLGPSSDQSRDQASTSQTDLVRGQTRGRSLGQPNIGQAQEQLYDQSSNRGQSRDQSPLVQRVSDDTDYDPIVVDSDGFDDDDVVDLVLSR